MRPKIGYATCCCHFDDNGHLLSTQLLPPYEPHIAMGDRWYKEGAEDYLAQLKEAGYRPLCFEALRLATIYTRPFWRWALWKALLWGDDRWWAFLCQCRALGVISSARKPCQITRFRDLRIGPRYN